MMIYISFIVFFAAFMCGVFELISGQIAAVISGLGLIMILVCTFSKPKYKEQELVDWCELLPIVDGIYAIKTDKNKFLCKYVDFENEYDVKIDVVNVKTDIETMEEDEKPTLLLFETKVKNAWLFLNDYTLYNVVLSIPENSVLEK